MFQWDGTGYQTVEVGLYDNEREKAKKANEVFGEGNLAVITSSTLGSGSKSTQAMKPIREIINKYGKLHGMYVSQDGSNFELHSLYHNQSEAEIVMRNLDAEVMILTSIHDRTDVQRETTRRELDQKGHHQLIQ